MNTLRLLRERIQWPWDLGLSGWLRVLRAAAAQVAAGHASVVAAALAFYAVLALFPGLLALVTLYGLWADPSDVELALGRLAGLLPASAWEILQGELRALIELGRTSLSFGLALSLLSALWSATSGVNALVDAVNWAYGQSERRGFLRRRSLSLQLTLGLIALSAVAIALVAVLPSIVTWFPRGPLLLQVLNVARWPLLLGAVTLGLLTLYRVAPCRARPRRWTISGALLASVLWLGVSAGFSYYVSEFGSYHKTYGALGGVIALLLWFYLSAFLVLFGAGVTAALEGESAGAAAPSASVVRGASSRGRSGAR
jgi:membrane protein